MDRCWARRMGATNWPACIATAMSPVTCRNYDGKVTECHTQLSFMLPLRERTRARSASNEVNMKFRLPEIDLAVSSDDELQSGARRRDGRASALRFVTDKH